MDTEIKKTLLAVYESGKIDRDEYTRRLLVLLNTSLFEETVLVCEKHRELSGVSIEESDCHPQLTMFEAPKKDALEGGCVTVCSELMVSSLSISLYRNEDGLAYCFEVAGFGGPKWQETGFIPSPDESVLEKLILTTIGRGERVRIPHFRVSDTDTKQPGIIPVFEPQGQSPKVFTREQKQPEGRRQYLRTVEIPKRWEVKILKSLPMFVLAMMLTFGLIQVFEWWSGQKAAVTAHSSLEFRIVGLLTIIAFLVLFIVEWRRACGWMDDQYWYWKNMARERDSGFSEPRLSIGMNLLLAVCTILKILERCLVSPWFFCPVVINIALFSLNTFRLDQGDFAGVRFGVFLAWYMLVFFYFLNISFFDLFVSSHSSAVLDRRFEDIRYSNYSHFVVSGVCARLFFQLIPDTLKKSILYTAAILGGVVPLVLGTLAPLSSRVFGAKSGVTGLISFIASSPDYFFYGFFFLCLLVFVLAQVVAHIATEPGILISAVVMLGLGGIIILYPQIFWRYNPASRPPMLISALLPPLGVVYAALQTLPYRVVIEKRAITACEYRIIAAWAGLLVCYVVTNLMFPMEG